MNVEEIVQAVVFELKKSNCKINCNIDIPVGVSNRHIHLSSEHLGILFGDDYVLNRIKDLSQPGQFACEECVTLVGTKGCIEKVRVLGPIRNQTQVEILASDCYKLGSGAPVRESGKLKDTPGISVVGPEGCVYLNEGVIIAQRHIHMTRKDADSFGVSDGQVVLVVYEGCRGGTFNNVIIRVSDNSRLDFHIDIDEANCFLVKDKDTVRIVK